jgi:hypothetical protein
MRPEVVRVAVVVNMYQTAVAAQPENFDCGLFVSNNSKEVITSICMPYLIRNNSESKLDK